MLRNAVGGGVVGGVGGFSFPGKSVTNICIVFVTM